MSEEMEQITLELDREHYPVLLARYSPEEIKKMAINMALKQYSERPLRATHLYSCLANLESDLEGMFG